MSGCAHMNQEEFCSSCAPAKLREARQEIERLTFVVNDRQERGNEMLARAERAEEEARKMRVALLLDAASFARIRFRWPHIEIPHGQFRSDSRVFHPGSPTCLRCSIEDEIQGPNREENAKRR